MVISDVPKRAANSTMDASPCTRKRSAIVARRVLESTVLMLCEFFTILNQFVRLSHIEVP